MSRGIRLSVVSICAVMLIGLMAGIVVTPANSSPPDVTPSGGSSPKTVVLELFTGTWCGPCAYTDPPLSRIADEYDPGKLVVLAYHVGASDPYSNPASQIRDNFYTIQFVPTIIVDGGGPYSDGTLWQIGATTSRGANYDTYRGLIDSQYAAGSALTISLSGDLTSTAATVTATITASDPPLANLATRFVLYEDAIYYMGSNREPYHRAVVRSLQELPLTISAGQTVVQTATFPLNPSWMQNKLGIAAFVQTNDRTQITIVVNSSPYSFWKAEILQGAKLDFVPAGILAYRDRGTAADYNGTYERILSQRGEHFRTWNGLGGTDTGSVDEFGLPATADLTRAPALVWYTGPTSTNVLSAEDRAVLGTHLDASGSLLITGSNIGFDARVNYPTWFQSYLHAQFNGDDTGLPSVTGVVGDPVSNAYAGVTLPVLGSPDRIDVAVPGPDFGVPFVYPGNIPGSVRAQHDADSRVVYLGFQYFEGSDTESRRASVLSDIISWMDGASAPKVSVVQPNGGEQVLPGQTYAIRWTAHDVRIPADAVDIYFTSNYGPSTTWELIASGEPNDGVYRWTVPDRDSASCRIKVVVRDGSSESPDGEAISAENFICGTPFFRINFGPGDVGWRLISFPVTMSDTTIQSVLSTITGSYASVRAYDASTPADPWKAYVPAKTGNDLNRLDNTMAFWIQITGPTTLDLMGDRPTAPTPIMLYAGWNLVGFPSMRTDYTVAQLKALTGATRVEGFDATATPYFLKVLPDNYVLTAGEGYWIYVPATVMWIVPV